MSEQSLDHYPFNFERLERGTVLECKVLEDAVGFSWSSERFGFALLALRYRIEEETGILCRIENSNTENICLHLMSHEEAAPWITKQARTRWLQFARNVRRREHVDPMALPEHEARKFESDTRVLAQMTAAGREAQRKALQLEAASEQQRLEAKTKQA
jgi:hypothetical protein